MEEIDSAAFHPDLGKSDGMVPSEHVNDIIQGLVSEIQDMEDLLNEATLVFNKQSISELTDYLTSKLLSKFNPSHTAFIFMENLAAGAPVVLCFKEKTQVPDLIKIPSMEPYRHFFSLSPTSVDFKVFEYMVGKAELTDVFKPLQPRKVIPILGFDGVHGMIVIGQKANGSEYTEMEIKYLDRLIQFASISFRNNIHYKRAITDFKTNLYNHSYFVMRIDEELSRIRRYKSEMSLLVLDVDHFKRFNDTYGHLAGDAVLASISKVLADSIRTEDVAARFGGEEFVVMVLQCNINFAWLAAERIRQHIEATVVEFEGLKLKVTVSIGAAHTSFEDQIPDSATLIKMADTALYQSKALGRNRTTLYRASLEDKAPASH